MQRFAATLLTLLALVGMAHAKPKPDKPEPTKSEPPGPGDKRRIIGILDVQVAGVPPDVAAKFQTKLEEQLDSREYWLAPQARMHELLRNSTKWSEGCFIGPCLMEVKIQTGAEVVLLAAINGDGTSFGYVVTLMRTDNGRYVSQEAERCDVCTVNEALTNATLAAVKLLTSLPDKLPDEAAEQHAAMDLATKKLEHDKVVMKDRHRKLATVLGLAGLAVAVGGAALYFTQDHANYGLATAAVGGGLMVGGLVALSF
jgi:hypothetical protein